MKARSGRDRILDWLKRYGLAECGGITCALIASLIVHRLTSSAVAAGYAGAWGESLGYGAVIIGRDFLTAARTKRDAREPFTTRDGAGVVGRLLVEFGPSALLDTFVTRPLAMALGTRLLGLPLGVITGKLAADALFYVPVIATYEHTRRATRRATRRPTRRPTRRR